MPILDTAVLFAAADRQDKFHASSRRHLEQGPLGTMLGTFALVEFDLVLKSRGYSAEGRSELMTMLMTDFPMTSSAVHPISPSTLMVSARLEDKFKLDYFDALLAGEAMELDGAIISSDREFDAISGLRRIPLVADASHG